MQTNVLTSRRLLRVLLIAICFASGALLFSTGAAQAKLIHPYTGQSFGPQGLGSGSFGAVRSVAVDQSTGDVYVLDTGREPEIYRFTATGEPADFSATGTNKLKSTVKVENYGELAVDGSSGPAKGDIYFADTHSVEIFSAAGLKIGELKGEVGESSDGVAVDPAGVVYVAYDGPAEGGRIRKYVPVANPVTEADYTSLLSESHTQISNIAVDGSGNVYAREGAYIERYTALQFGSLEAEGTTIPGGTALAVDPASNHVYIDEYGRVVELDEAGELVSVTAEEELREHPYSYGLSVSSLNGDIYVDAEEGSSEGGSSKVRVLIFAGAPVVVPDATTETPTDVTDTSATLNGSVNPGGLAATYQFQYGTTTNYGSMAPASAEPTGSDSTTHQVSAELAGLMSGSTYHYRIVAHNANGTTFGADQALYVHGPPTVVAGRVTFAYHHYVEMQVQVSPHGLDTHYHLEYGTTSAYGESTAPVDLGSQGETQSAYAELEGLALGTIYHFRVVATNADGTVYGPDRAFSTAPVATISNETALDLTESSVTLSAKANDYYVASSAHFEYGATSGYGASTAPVSLEPEEYPLTTTAPLTELQAGTTYHYRLVLENEIGVEYGADATFKTSSVTAPSPALPDGRAYERVSSAANAGNDVYQDLPYLLEPYEGSSTELPFLVSADGSAVAYIGGPSERGGIGKEGSNVGNQYVARRDAQGRWNAVNVEPSPSSPEDRAVFKGFSPDLSTGFVNSLHDPPLAPGAPGEGYSDLYATTFATGSYTPLVTSKPEHRTPQQFGAANMPKGENSQSRLQLAYAGGSASLGHELFMANDTLTANAVDGGVEENNLYDTSGGSTTLVNVLPDGSAEPNATFGGPRLPQDVPYNTQIGNYPMLAHDISEDGRRVFWTDLNTDALYVRENDTAPESPRENGKCTIPADACTVLIAEDAQYWNATPDGSKVLYTSGGDLYEYDLQTGATSNLAPGGGVHGVVAASSDFSYVYFVAEAALTANIESHECIEGGGVGSRALCNLYVSHVGSPLRFIGVLSGSDNFTQPQTYIRKSGDWQGSLADTEAEATPDGLHLVFTSKANLTSYEGRGHGEVFMYDYASNEIHCMSCLPSGEQPEVNSFEASAFLPVSGVGTAMPHWMSDDGDRVFFDSLEALVPQDTNNHNDVYEWERNGSGGCTESSGCIHLLSDGTSSEGSYLIGASASGDDVFITTRGRLVPEDENENIDVYDIHANAAAPPAASQCTGSGCQGIPATPPIFATPPSVTYNGVGNFDVPAKNVSVKPKSLSQSGKLAKALRACRRKSKQKRRSCEAQARKRYGVGKKSTGSSLRRLGNVGRSSKGGK